MIFSQPCFYPIQTKSFPLLCQVGTANALQYRASGGSDDWAKSLGIKWVFLMELPDEGKHGFLLPAKFIRRVSGEAFAAFRAATVRISYTLV